jgi:lipid-A-disaccharide synthase
VKYYLIAGEASGDLHGSNLIKALQEKDPAAEIMCWGGDKMKAAGGRLVKHYRELAFMGFTEVLMNIRTILNNIAFCKQDIADFNPDVIILIDYPGFNLRIAEWAHDNGYKVVFYISPQVWAWKENRVKKIRRSVDLMLVILPFEKDFYAGWNYPVSFVGHPLLDAIKDLPQSALHYEKPVIALLPGSRKQEIKVMLPLMLEMTDHFRDYQFVVAQAPSQPEDLYAEMIDGRNVEVVRNRTYELLQIAEAAMVTSGTATLEAALFNVPQVVCYKGGFISYQIAKRLIKVKYISLVNLILDKPCVTELIQDELNEERLKKELGDILAHGPKRKKMLEEYQELKIKLGSGGASERAAGEVLQFLNQKAAGRN